MLPAPPSCAADVQFVPAVLGSAFLFALFAALLVTDALIRTGHRDRTLRIFLVVVVIAAVVVPLWTLSASGFALGWPYASGLAAASPQWIHYRNILGALAVPLAGAVDAWLVR